MKKILFKGQEFYLVGESDGPIATKEQYEKGLCSYAHLMPGGQVMRFRAQIGDRTDIEIVGEEELEQSPTAMDTLLGGVADPESWAKPEKIKDIKGTVQ